MHVCMHACMHACMYACMYVCIYVCIYVCMHTSRLEILKTNTHRTRITIAKISRSQFSPESDVPVYVYTHIYIKHVACLYVCMLECMYVCMYVCMYGYTSLELGILKKKYRDFSLLLGTPHLLKLLLLLLQRLLQLSLLLLQCWKCCTCICVRERVCARV